jgi:methylated-DNA-[protein]-cysteine S-methyltransferase
VRYFSDVDTPLGSIRIVANESAVIAVGFYPQRNAKLARLGLSGKEGASNLTEKSAGQLVEYFAGDRQEFDLPVDFGRQTLFSKDVLCCLAGIPYGEILSYGALATLSGHPKAARAVGRVMAVNPLPIIVPCHRIVGATGQLTGYSGGDGLSTKEWLLALERQNSVS